MPNDLTTHSTLSPLALLTSHSWQEINAALAIPADQPATARALRDLLWLYWIAADSPEERVRQIAIIVRDLATFPDCVVSWTIHEWRTTQDRRPSAAALIQLCNRRLIDLRDRRDALYDRDQPAPPPPPDLTKQQLFERRYRQEQTMLDAGYVRAPEGWITEAEARERAEADAKADANRPPHWSETAAPDDPRWQQVRRDREENPLMRHSAFAPMSQDPRAR